jgi:hypothetical protein
LFFGESISYESWLRNILLIVAQEFVASDSSAARARNNLRKFDGPIDSAHAMTSLTALKFSMRLTITDISEGSEETSARPDDKNLDVHVNRGVYRMGC